MLIESAHLNLIDLGDGDRTVVFLHGWCCRPGDFAQLATSLSQRHRVLAIDWQQRMRRRGKDCSFDGICADLTDLFEKRKVVAPLICGHSFGGSLALYLGATRTIPHCRFVALDSTLPFDETIKEVLRHWNEELHPESVDAFYAGYMTNRLFSVEETGSRSDAIIQNMRSVALDEARQLLEQQCQIDWKPVFASISQPCHYVASSINQVFTGELLASLIPTSTYERMEQGGHFMSIFHPAQVERIIEQRLAAQ